MDAPLLTPHDLVRPWKRATVVASAIAAAELAALIGAGLFLVAKPLSHEIQKQALASVAVPVKTTPPSHALRRAIARMKAPAGRARPRSDVRIMVFNGNGRSGAAGDEATQLAHLGYKVTGTANARRQDYASSVVMYRSGFRAEGMRLAHDLHVKVVGPLDGIAASTLHGGELVVIVGN